MADLALHQDAAAAGLAGLDRLPLIYVHGRIATSQVYTPHGNAEIFV
jgi:hypothetical protein